METPTDDLQPGNELRAPEYSLRQISYFLAAAQHQSLQKAAESLHVSPPAISAAIAHLEDALKAKLFMRRHSRGLVLTETGSDFAVECRSLLQSAWQLGTGRIADRREIQGRIHLGCLFSFAPYLVPKLLNLMAARYPKVRIQWHEGHHEYLLEGLRTGAIDLAVSYDFDLPSSVNAVPLREAPLRVVLPPSHPLLRAGKVITPADLATEPMVLLDMPLTRDYLLSTFAAAGVMPKIAFRVHSVGMLLGLVAEGHGFGLLNFCPPFTHSKLLSQPVKSPQLVVAHSHSYRLNQAAAAVLDVVGTLISEFAMHPDDVHVSGPRALRA